MEMVPGAMALTRTDGSEFLGEDAGHEDNSGFGDGMGKKFGPAENTADVGEIDDDAVAGFREVGSSGLGEEEGCFEIGVERSVPGGFGGGAEFGFEEIGGAVDENVQLAEVGGDIGDEFLDGGDVGEFRGKGGGAATEFLDFGNEFVGFAGGLAVVNGHIRTFAGQAKSYRTSETFGRAGNEGHAAVEIRFVSHAKKVAHPLPELPQDEAGADG